MSSLFSISTYLPDSDLPTGLWFYFFRVFRRCQDNHDRFCLGLEQKNVIIQRDRFGYGLTVSGDNPVYVLSVREGGAAQRAGINTNDQIIKVKYLFYNLLFNKSEEKKTETIKFDKECLSLYDKNHQYFDNNVH